MSLQISTQRAILDWNTQRSQLNMSGNGNQNVLRTSTVKPQIQIQTEKPRIEIDQSQCFSEAGLMGIFELTSDNVSYAKQKVSEAIGRIIDQGNQMLNIHEDYDPIPDQAITNAYEIFEHEFVYDTIPKSRPKIDVQRGNVDVQLNEGKVNNETELRKVQGEYSPGGVEFFMKQYHKVEISYTGNNLDMKV